MYCNKCGKEIESGTVCSECLAQSMIYNSSAETVKEEASVSNKTEKSEGVREAEPSYQYGNSSYSTEGYASGQYGNGQYYEQNSASYVYHETEGMPEPENRMYGFGKALASTIVGFVGFIWNYVSMIVILSMMVTEPEAAVASGIILSLLALPLVIIPVILGITSIKTFVKRKATCKKPIPALILGIVGIDLGGSAAILGFITFCFTLVII